MHLPWLNRSQRIVVVIALGVALYVLGTWFTAPQFPVASGWAGYAPLTSSFVRMRWSGGADLVLWFALIAVWVLVSTYLLRTRTTNRDDN
jgi:hypothetical protein